MATASSRDSPTCRISAWSSARSEFPTRTPLARFTRASSSGRNTSSGLRQRPWGGRPGTADSTTWPDSMSSPRMRARPSPDNLPKRGGNIAAAGHTPPDVGSIIIVVATDAPLMPVHLNRVARRAALGMGRLGSYSGNGSGDLIVSFTTASAAANDPDQPHPSALTPLANEARDPRFKAGVEATEASVVNALGAA